MPASGRPEDDTPTGVYTIPEQDKRHISFRTTSGDVVEAVCYTVGQEIEDGRHRKSTIWVAIGTTAGKTGLIPAFATGYALPPDACTANELAGVAAGPTIS